MIDPCGGDLGRRVIYRDLGRRKIEEGVITSYNPEFVFVRFGGGCTSAATRREDLDWTSGAPDESATDMTIRP